MIGDKLNVEQESHQPIVEFGQELLSSLDRELVLRRLLTRLIAEFQVERGSIWAVEDKNVKLLFSLNQFGEEDHISYGMREFKEKGIPIGIGYVGIAAQSGEPNIDNTPQYSVQHYREVDKKMGHVTRNIITIPLMRKNRPIGVLQLLDRVNDAPFTQTDQQRLLTYAPWATIALDNANVYAEMSALSEQMAHNIKGYLGSSRFRLSYLEGKLQHLLDTNDKELLHSIYENIGRSIRLIEVHLGDYRIVKKENVSPRQLMDETIAIFGKQMEVINTVSADLPNVTIEKETTIAHFLEILTNATKAIEGHIRQGGIEAGKIEIWGTSDDQDYVSIRFANNGIVIPKAEWVPIFNKYVSVTEGNANKGSGLGLWGAKKFLERQGGRIYVEKSDNEQTVFVILLPMTQAIVKS
jgi:signal transduction histidine kinase